MTVIENEIHRCDEEGLVAINSKLGWILSGPVSAPAFTEVNFTHVMKVEMNETSQLNEKIEYFWNLDSIGVKENEGSVYDRFVEEVTFKNGRYEVSLLFKEGHPMIEDNYALCYIHLQKLDQEITK